ncbi:hypothetical protein [Halosimplex pelagicum]|uniref:Uncharacterized protein n=1 Tax=Halosimplex pelagicum TaxID=869886 RepID=A0A7D5TCM2_9EURY|nr:hypothetical protein [Halosimplex pelagicum]QLH83233.1 hypothetical protein HZS54_17055 [Halosimplex pelagicum]
MSGTDRPSAINVRSDEDAPDECENCPRVLKTVAYVNGRTLCGRCYGWKMGYYRGEPEYSVDTDQEGHGDHR